MPVVCAGAAWGRGSFLWLSRWLSTILCGWGETKQSIYTLPMRVMVLSSLGRQILFLFPAPFCLETAKQGECWLSFWELCPPALLLCRGINSLGPVYPWTCVLGHWQVGGLLALLADCRSVSNKARFGCGRSNSAHSYPYQNYITSRFGCN